jgi:hypothetical protein
VRLQVLHKRHIHEARHEVGTPALVLAVVYAVGALYLNIYDLRTTILKYRKDVDKLVRKVKPLIEKDEKGNFSVRVGGWPRSEGPSAYDLEHRKHALQAGL